MVRSDFDILILGSGPSGVQAAKEATGHGVRVGLVDVGHEDHRYVAITPNRPFAELRRNDPNQQKYFLGEALEGVDTGDQKTGPQLTPARKFIIRDTEKLLPIESENFQAIQSLALGGLGAGWGAGCACYEEDELTKVGLPVQTMKPYYERVAQDIGVSGPKEDDISEHVAMLSNIQPPLVLDSNAQSLFVSYQNKRASMLAKGFKMGRPLSAILTIPMGARKPNPYHDMDFWSDAGESVYRPRFTLRELQQDSNFHYMRPFLAKHFEENNDGTVSLFVVNLDTNSRQTLHTKRLLLAAGAINTARVVLLSMHKHGTRVPLLTNPYSYIPAVNLPMLGRRTQDRRHSMVQLSSVYLPGSAPEERLIAQFYSYRSLLLFKLARGIPLPPSLAMLMSRVIVSSLMIVGINHADETSPNRWLALKQTQNGSDCIEIHSERSRAERRKLCRHELGLLRRLLSLRLLPLNVTHLPEGASIHYAGTLPFSEEERPLTCNSNGRLHGTKNVFVTDGSTWKFLPAKGLAFSLMANSRRIAELVTNDLKEHA